MMTMDRLRNTEAPSENVMDQWRHYFFANIGDRYAKCDWDNFKVENEKQSKAVLQCVDYFERFSQYAREGRGLLFIGPPGTGKDHLLIATAKQIMARYIRCKIRYRDGMALVSELRQNKFDEDESERISEIYAIPSLLCLSDPLPPVGNLDDFEQRCMYRIIDRRYRLSLPTCATLNVAKRKDLDEKMGPQAADRLCEGAVVVVCDWESYRTRTS